MGGFVRVMSLQRISGEYKPTFRLAIRHSINRQSGKKNHARADPRGEVEGRTIEADFS
jgi:hypothetical protein